MDRFDFYPTPHPPKRFRPLCKYLLIILSIFLGLLCLAGFIFASIQWDANSSLGRNCHHNQTQEFVLCYIRSIISDGRRTQWDRFILTSLLLTYASVFFHIIIESTRTNVSGLLGQMIIQTICIIFGIGVAFPILFIPAYLHFYQSKQHSSKAPVPISLILIGFIYTVLFIIIPTYLISFLSTNELILTIMSILLLISPLVFALLSLPFRFLSGRIQRYWLINSHRLIVICQVVLFISSSPLFFFTLVALIENWTSNLFKQSYVIETSNTINPVTIIWSIDYTSLVLGLILFISINEYLCTNNNDQSESTKIRRILVYVVFAIIFIIAPCLAFPLYIAWKEYQYLNET